MAWLARYSWMKPMTVLTTHHGQHDEAVDDLAQEDGHRRGAQEHPDEGALQLAQHELQDAVPARPWQDVRAVSIEPGGCLGRAQALAATVEPLQGLIGWQGVPGWLRCAGLVGVVGHAVDPSVPC